MPHHHALSINGIHIVFQGESTYTCDAVQHGLIDQQYVTVFGMSWFSYVLLYQTKSLAL